jgi:hypothetical protein
LTLVGVGGQLAAMAITDEDITTRWDAALTPNGTLVMEADADGTDGDADGTDGDADGTDGDADGTDGSDGAADGDAGGTDGDA